MKHNRNTEDIDGVDGFYLPMFIFTCPWIACHKVVLLALCSLLFVYCVHHHQLGNNKSEHCLMFMTSVMYCSDSVRSALLILFKINMIINIIMICYVHIPVWYICQSLNLVHDRLNLRLSLTKVKTCMTKIFPMFSLMLTLAILVPTNLLPVNLV